MKWATMAKVWARIRETIERHGSAALVSVVGAAGSVPRESGARIVLQPNGGFFGTIGGGQLEYAAIDAAGKALAGGRGKAEFRDWPLGPNLGQCCGGMVKTLTETFDANDLVAVRRLEAAEQAGAFATHSQIDDEGRIARTLAADEGGKKAHSPTPFAKMAFHEQFGEISTPVLLFGAGHVGRAVVLALAPLPFAVHWIELEAGSISAACAEQCGDHPQRASCARAGASAERRFRHSHDALAPDRFRHHGGGVAARDF